MAEVTEGDGSGVLAKLSEHGKKIFQAVSSAATKAQAILSPKMQTELASVLADIPPTCSVTKMSRKGLLRKKLILTLECRDASEPTVYGEVELED